MYDLTAFDKWWLKLLGWLGAHFYVVLVVWGSLFVVVGTLEGVPTVIKYMIIPFPPLVLLVWFLTMFYTPGERFRANNHLQRFFSGRHNTWRVVAPQYRSMKNAATLTPSSYGKYGESLIGIVVSGSTLPIAFVGVEGCVAWMELSRSFPHTIIDTMKDHKSFKWARNADGERLREISLEGDFPENFKVYQEEDRQTTTLRILTPDRMAYLIDQLGEFNIEIHDTYLRLYSARAQKSSEHFRAFLDALDNIREGFKVDKLNKMR